MCSYYQWPIDLPYPPLIFTGGQKVRFLALSLTSARIWAAVVSTPSKMSSTFLNSVCSDYLTMSPPSLVQIGPRVFKITPTVLKHPLKTDEKICRYSSITQPGIDRSRSNSVGILTTWYTTCRTCSRSRGQRSRSQRDVMGAKICQITQPGIVRFRSNLLQTMTTWHRINHKL